MNKKFTPGHIRVKVHNSNNKEKILEIGIENTLRSSRNVTDIWFLIPTVKLINNENMSTNYSKKINFNLKNTVGYMIQI